MRKQCAKWTTVPSIPTDEMIAAGDGENHMNVPTSYVADIWQAMIAAAPVPKVEGLEVVAWMWRRHANAKWDALPRWDAIEEAAALEMEKEGWDVVKFVRQSDAARVIAYWRDAFGAATNDVSGLRTRITEMEKARTEPVAEVYRHGRDSAGRKWHGVTWYDQNADIPSGTRLYTDPPDATATLERDMRKMAEKRNGELLAELTAANERIASLDSAVDRISAQATAEISALQRRLDSILRERDVAVCVSNTYQKQVIALEQDAARYRWLRKEHARNDPIAAVVWKKNRDKYSDEWVNTADAKSLDTAIDAARKEAQP